MVPKVAPVKNVQSLIAAYNAVEKREPGTDGMILLHGATGSGKTTAIGHLLNYTNAICVEASPAWSLGSMYRAILLEIGVDPKGRNADMEKFIADEMNKNRRPLFIDELDHLLLPGATTTLRMLEALRSIHDKSKMPVLMIGMDKIDQKIALREQLNRRIFQKVKFLDLDRDDLRTVADTLSDIPIADDFLDALYTNQGGRISYISQCIKYARRRARGNRWDEINMARWGAPIFGSVKD